VDGRVPVSDRTQVALEVSDVHRVETNDRHKQPDIRLCKRIPDEIVLAGQHLLEAIETLKERVHRLLVRLLRSREPSLVHAIVDGIVHPRVDRVDLLAVLFRVDIDRRFGGGNQLVEGGVEDADDFRAFVVDDRLCFLVPENWDGKPAAIVGVRFEIEILDVLGVVQRLAPTRRTASHGSVLEPSITVAKDYGNGAMDRINPPHYHTYRMKP